MATPPPPELPAGGAGRGEPEGRMSFFEHLTELRKRLVYSLIAIGIGALVGFSVAEKMLAILSRPMQEALHTAHLADKLIYTSPTGVIALIIHLGFYLGLVIASPFVFYQIWLFVAPGLYKHERRAVVTFVVSSVGLFLGGIAFGYFILLPIVLRFLISFQGPFTPLISINEYFDLTLLVLIGLGLIFELPVLIFFLSLIGVVTPKFLWKNMRYAILVITIIAAVVTPSPDATTMLIFMAPMVVLYLAGIGVSYMVVRSKRKAAMAGSAGQERP
ncbi:MAG: twin-arginine translocase subunit TatC [Acidobacteriota bacterium]|nr:twin-arginine translocase subunit TatC [Acidobacteriota bacterium]